MLRQLSIQNYRVFSHFELDELALVNLIVGMNNSGKSSLLEAIYLLTSDDPTLSLFHILDERGEVINDMGYDKWRRNGYPLAHLFHGHLLEPTKSIQIIGTDFPSNSGKEVSLSVESNGRHGRHGRLQETEIESNTSLVLEQTTVDSTAIQSRFPLHRVQLPLGNGNLFLRSSALPFVGGHSRLVTLNYSDSNGICG